MGGDGGVVAVIAEVVGYGEHAKVFVYACEGDVSNWIGTIGASGHTRGLPLYDGSKERDFLLIGPEVFEGVIVWSSRIDRSGACSCGFLWSVSLFGRR